MQKRSSPTPSPKAAAFPPPAKGKAAPKTPLSKKPLDEREYPAARDISGKARRPEIRKQTVNFNAPRSSQRPVERSNQSRSRKSS